MDNRKYRRPLLIVLVLLLIVALAGVLFYRPIQNKIIFDSASPAMQQLADTAGMNHAGKLLFFAARPKLDSLKQMAVDCPNKTAKDGYVEQGCFAPSNNRIYLRDMPTDLKDVETVTAAHEMLHAAYKNLSASDKTRIDNLLEQEVKMLNDPKLNDRLKEYAHLEPGARDNELHSIIGTEYSKLSPTLSNYYDKYFSDRAKTVAANAYVQDLFQKSQTKLSALKANIEQGRADSRALYVESAAAAKSGDVQGDSHYYALYVAKVKAVNKLIDAYNTLLDQYNALSSEYNGQPASALPAVTAHGAS